MPFTPEQLENIEKMDEAYKTFLLSLWDVVRTQEDGSVIRVTGIPFYMIANRVHELHGLSEADIQKMARSLISLGWISVDKFGFYVPIGQGIEILRVLMKQLFVPTAPPPPVI